MATIEGFLAFSPTPYQRLPVVNTATTLTLARALRERTPSEVPAPVAKRVERLDAAIAEAEALFTEQRREQGPRPYGVAMQFDGGVDGLWTATHSRLHSWSAFEHPGLDPIADDESPLAALITEGRERADRAQAMVERLFGEDGLRPMRSPFHEQAEHTGALVRLIQEDGLEDELAALIGPRLVKALLGLQPIYEQMVLDRLADPKDKLTGLRELRRRLRRRISDYVTQILALVDEDEPASLDFVVAALEPIVALREQVARRGRTGNTNDRDLAPALDPAGDTTDAPPPNEAA